MCLLRNAAVTQWMPKWKRNGWKTVNGEDVKNRADLEKLSNACSMVDVKWVRLFSVFQSILRLKKND